MWWFLLRLIPLSTVRNIRKNKFQAWFRTRPTLLNNTPRWKSTANQLSTLESCVVCASLSSGHRANSNHLRSEACKLRWRSDYALAVIENQCTFVLELANETIALYQNIALTNAKLLSRKRSLPLVGELKVKKSIISGWHWLAIRLG